MSEDCLSGPSKNCFICGSDNPAGLKLCFKEEEKGVVMAEFVVPGHLNGFKGVMHGGIISAVLDDGMDWAIYSATRKWYVTTQMTVNFKRSVSVPQKLKLRAWLSTQDGRLLSLADQTKVRKIQFARAELTSLSGDVLASSEGKFFQIPEEKTKDIVL